MKRARGNDSLIESLQRDFERVDRELTLATLDRNEAEVREYEEGSLIIDVMDQNEKKVVWRGIGQRRLRGEGAPTDPEELQKRADEVAAAVLKDFPPPPRT